MTKSGCPLNNVIVAGFVLLTLLNLFYNEPVLLTQEGEKVLIYFKVSTALDTSFINKI
jgi:hypothetical protein